jgi:FeS assembly protein IscX
MPLDWTMADAIGIALYEKFPEMDPLSVRFTDLHKLVIGLEEFEDDPKGSDESKLEAIQMAWHEEFEENA